MICDFSPGLVLTRFIKDHGVLKSRVSTGAFEMRSYKRTLYRKGGVVGEIALRERLIEK